jgi:hypothetical protein
MPKLRREEVADLDVKTLDEQEYTEGDFDTYEGEIPPANTELTGYVNKMWWCRTAEKSDGSGLDPMIKVLWVAADNEGDEEEYNGLPIWENLVLVPGAKFRWAPFLDTFGITLKAIKSDTYVGDEDDERVGGAPIEKIGTFVPGEDSDAAWSRVLTKRRFYNDEWRVEAKSWLPWADGDGSGPADNEDAEADAEVLTNEAGEELTEDDDGNIVDAEGNIYEEDDEGNWFIPEPEEPAEPEPPARGRRAAKPAATPARASKPARPAAGNGARTARRAPAEPATASTSRRAARSAAASKAAKPAAARGRGRKPADNDPPF